jgi:riboflavin synthase
VRTPLGAELTPGDSIAVNGVCLTVTTRTERGFTADVSPETLAVTSLGALEPERLVNLERPLRADARLGGHFVLGHVDGIGSIVGLSREGDYYRLEVEVPDVIAPCVILKGSVAIDGVSLTVAGLSEASPLVVHAQIVPFTFGHTALAGARVGDVVNVEGDVLGKYVQRLLRFGESVVPLGGLSS